MDQPLPVINAIRAVKLLPKTHPSLLLRASSHVIPYDRKIVAVMRRGGIVDPWTTLHAARHVVYHKNGYLSVCCAILEMESDGGRNIFGQDLDDKSALPEGWAGTEVIWSKYVAYRILAKSGYTPVGVGPCQLVDLRLQRGADLRGGCWVPLHNMVEGFSFINRLVADSGSIWIGFYNYNGGKPSSGKYADRALAIQRRWQDRFKRVK